MEYYRQKITLVKLKKPTNYNINKELQWFGSSLGLFSIRDKDKSCFRVFVELLKSSKENQTLTSDELALKLELSRGTIIHHINKLIDSGLVIHEGNKYTLRVDNLRTLVEEIEKDIKRVCDDIREVAKEIDKRLGL